MREAGRGHQIMEGLVSDTSELELDAKAPWSSCRVPRRKRHGQMAPGTEGGLVGMGVWDGEEGLLVGNVVEQTGSCGGNLYVCGTFML